MTVAEMLVKIGAETTGFQRGLAQAEAQVKGFKKIGDSTASVGRTMTRYVTLPILGAAAASVKLAADYQETFNKIQALTGASAKQTQQWQSQVLSMAKTLPQSPQELAEALYFVASSGVKASDAMSVLKSSAKAAAAGLGDTQTVAEVVTSAMNAYGAKNLSAAQATDDLVKAIQVGKAEPAEFAGSIGRVIPVAQAMGVEFHEAAGAVAALTNTGLDAAEATTAVRGVMTSLIKPTAQGRKAFERLYGGVDNFRKIVAERGLLPALIDLRKKIGDNKDATGKLFPNVRALNGFLALTGQNAKQNSALMDQMADSTGATDKALKDASKGGMFQIRQAWSSIQAAAIQAGAVLLPIVASIMGKIASLASAFSGLSSGTQHWILVMAGVMAVVGPVLIGLGKLVIFAANVQKALIALRASTLLTSAAFGPLGIALAAVTAAAGLLTLAWLSNRNQSDAMTDAFNRAKRAVDGLRASMDNAKKTDLEARMAKAQHQASILGVERATRNLNQAVKQYGKDSLEAREAANQLKQARLNEKQAANGERAATAAATKAKRAARAEYIKSRDSLMSLSQAGQKETGVMQRLTSKARENGTASRGTAAAIVILAKRTQSYAANADKLAGKLQTASGKMGGLRTAMGRSLSNMAAASRKAAELARAIGRIPTKKEIAIIIKTTEYSHQTDVGRHAATHGAKGGHRAGGGPVHAGQTYIVGERRQELFTPNTSGRILPDASAAIAGATASRGGDVIVRIENPIFLGRDRHVAAEIARLVKPHLNQKPGIARS